MCRPDRPRLPSRISRRSEVGSIDDHLIAKRASDWIPRGADPNFKHFILAKTKSLSDSGKVISKIIDHLKKL